MSCNKCGHNLAGEAKFCTHCGSPVQEDAQVETDDQSTAARMSNPKEVDIHKYMLLEETNEKKLVEKLNELGRQNWEAVAYTIAMGAMGKGHHFVLLKQKVG